MRTFTVTVERPTTDPYGERLPDPATHEVAGCIHWPGQSTEANGAYTQTTSTRVLSAPAGADILKDDLVVYPDGSRWAVIGEPWDWDNPQGRHRPGLQVTLERAV